MTADIHIENQLKIYLSRYSALARTYLMASNCYWNGECWICNRTENALSIAMFLKSLGFTVNADDTLNSQINNIEKHPPRWITTTGNGKFIIKWHCQLNEYYKVVDGECWTNLALRLSGSYNAGGKGYVIVPSRSWREIMDFAEMHNFEIMDSAKAIIGKEISKIDNILLKKSNPITPCLFNITTELLPHQISAADKMMKKSTVALFMESGTGKTLVALECFRQRIISGSCKSMTVFCPVNVKYIWMYEIARHTDISYDDIYVFDDKTENDTIPPASIYIVGIESMSSSSRVWLSAIAATGPDTFAIVDESSFIKVHSSNRSERITMCGRRCSHRMIMTGTSITNDVQDLYSQLYLLDPAILGYNSYYSFAANHLEYSERFPNKPVKAHNTQLIADKIAPYVYQVKKSECLELPETTQRFEHYQMTNEQWHYYQLAKNEILFDRDIDDVESHTLLMLFTALQQIACGYWNRKTDKEKQFIRIQHNRLQALKKIIDKHPNEKIIIWCKYLHEIEEISEMLAEEYGSKSFVEYSGNVAKKDRPANIIAFKNNGRFLVGTPSTGGYGGTFTECSAVVFYSNSFKYEERKQAKDRVHRLGQSKVVNYYDIICERTIDERILISLARKRDVAEEFANKIEMVKAMVA